MRTCLTSPERWSTKQRGCDGLRCGHARGVIGNDWGDHLRPPGLAIALDVGEPRHRLNNRIVGPLTRVRTPLAEPGDRNVDEVATQRADRIFAEADALRGARPKVMDQSISSRDQLINQLAAAIGLEIDRERALIAVAGHKRRIHAVAATAEMTHQVAARGLDFND